MKKNVECGMYSVDYIHDELLKEGLVYVIDGSSAHTKQEYFNEWTRIFNIPEEEDTKWARYADWMRDFRWLPEDKHETPITIVLTHYIEFLKDSYADKQLVMDVFYEYAFPFWSDEVTYIRVGGQTRSFKVYLISGDGTKEGQGPKLHLVEYRPLIREEDENDFKRAWFAYGDNTFPPEIEQIVKSMKPGESRIVDAALDSSEQTLELHIPHKKEESRGKER